MTVHNAEIAFRAARERRDRWLHIALVAAQLAGALVVVRLFKLESPAFFQQLLLCCIGFVLSAYLPARDRAWFFVGLSIVCVVVAIGIGPATIVLSIGAVLIATCHLPISWMWRITALMAIGVALAVYRAETEVLSLAGIALPILASMFMFRLMLYVHALRTEKVAFGVSNALAYFFMVPNAVFPLFPIVDYSTFVRSKFDGDEIAIYNEGVRWIYRGMIHLLLYRFVTQEAFLGGLWVNDLGDVTRHVMTTHLLYLQVSGQFHIIAGLLHLFGFRLPETNHLYYLASSLSDVWRRFNIYWKDFMTKLVFYPSFFRLRSWSNRGATITATFAVFGASWVLHSYQQFWLLGKPRLTWQDGLFWATAAVLVVATVLWQTRKGARLGREPQRWSLQRGLATTATLLTVGVLWSLWNSESIETWALMWTMTRYSTPSDWLFLAGILFAGTAVAGFGWDRPLLVAGAQERKPLRIAWRTPALRLAAVLGSSTLILSAASSGAFPVWLTKVSRQFVGSPLPNSGLPLRVANYYEGLQPEAVRPGARAWHVRDTSVVWSAEIYGAEVRSDFLVRGLRPGHDSVFLGKRASINRWGMRDRDYAEAKPPNTFRIALIGSSVEMGWGVDDTETFEALVEAQLDSAAARAGRHIEVLNFSVPGWSSAQSAYAVAHVAQRFEIDLVLFSVHSFDLELSTWTLREVRRHDIVVPDSILSHLLEEANVTDSLTHAEVRIRLRTVEEAWTTRVVRWAAENAAQAGASVVALATSVPNAKGETTLTPYRRALDAAGLSTLDCTRAFDGHEATSLVLPNEPEVSHPNAAGHRLIADCLVDKLREHPSLVPDWSVPTSAATEARRPPPLTILNPIPR